MPAASGSGSLQLFSSDACETTCAKGTVSQRLAAQAAKTAAVLSGACPVQFAKFGGTLQADKRRGRRAAPAKATRRVDVARNIRSTISALFETVRASFTGFKPPARGRGRVCVPALLAASPISILQSPISNYSLFLFPAVPLSPCSSLSSFPAFKKPKIHALYGIYGD